MDGEEWKVAPRRSLMLNKSRTSREEIKKKSTARVKAFAHEATNGTVDSDICLSLSDEDWLIMLVEAVAVVPVLSSSILLFPSISDGCSRDCS